MLQPTPRSLRIWEVVSVIQDLPYTRQLEIILDLKVESVLLEMRVYREYFVMSDLKLLSEVEQYILNGQNLTRLTALYIIILSPREGLNVLETQELSDYFQTFPIAKQVKLKALTDRYFYRLRFRNISNVLKSTIVEYTVANGLTDIVRPLLSDVRILDMLLNSAIEAKNDTVLEEALGIANAGMLFDLAYLRLHEANPYYFLQIVDRYNSMNPKGFITVLSGYWIDFGDWYSDGKAKARIKMLLDAAPDTDFRAMFRRMVGSLFAYEFVVETVDRFDWTSEQFNELERKTIQTVLDNQV